MNIYISSSWKNRNSIRALAVALRTQGHTVYDFTDPASRQGVSEVPPERYPEQFDPTRHDYAAYLKAIPEWRAAIEQNRAALLRCDLCILLLPCGADSHADWGIAVGAGKRSIVVGHPKIGERTPSHLWAEAILSDVAAALQYLQ